MEQEQPHRRSHQGSAFRTYSGQPGLHRQQQERHVPHHVHAFLTAGHTDHDGDEGLDWGMDEQEEEEEDASSSRPSGNVDKERVALDATGAPGAHGWSLTVAVEPQQQEQLVSLLQSTSPKQQQQHQEHQPTWQNAAAVLHGDASNAHHQEHAHLHMDELDDAEEGTFIPRMGGSLHAAGQSMFGIQAEQQEHVSLAGGRQLTVESSLLGAQHGQVGKRVYLLLCNTPITTYSFTQARCMPLCFHSVFGGQILNTRPHM